MHTKLFWITKDRRFGIFGATLDQAFSRDLEFDPPINFVLDDWRTSTRQELEASCLDWRFDGHWQQ